LCPIWPLEVLYLGISLFELVLNLNFEFELILLFKSLIFEINLS